MRSNRFYRVSHPSIENERELFFYVTTVTAICVTIALAVDITNQLTFFVSWTECLRSWCITAVLALFLAIPISRTLGKAHLELYRAKSRAEALGRTDQLTGLPNRRALIESVKSRGFGALALVIVDIDWFKRVNDMHGHLVGDAVIRSVGQTMAIDLGMAGMVARVGGEEFALLSSAASADIIAAKLDGFRERISSTPFIVEGLSVRVTISAGVAIGRDGDTFDKVYSEADRALYAAKRSGRNRVCAYPAVDVAGEFPSSREPNPDPIRRSA